MTGFSRRLVRWWTQRRPIDDALAADVGRYIERHWAPQDDEGADAALYDLLEERGAPLPDDDWDLTCAAAPASLGSGAEGMEELHQPPASTGAMPLEDLLQNLDEPFSQTLLQMIDARGLTDAQVYHRAHLSRQHFSKIRSNPDYRPTKPTVLALAIALGLTLDETRLLLERSGFTLSHASKQDVIVEYFIERGERDLNVVNRTLYHFDQPVLGN